MSSTLELPWWMPSPEAQAERERILASKYFLVKIAGNGDVWKCRGCGSKHRYLTLRCVEQPFSGLTGGLYAYYQTTGVHGAQNFLSPGQRARYDRMGELFGKGRDLADAHPQLARQLSTGERDADWGAVALGILEPVTKAKAQQLVNAINGRGCRPPLIVPGLDR